MPGRSTQSLAVIAQPVPKSNATQAAVTFIKQALESRDMTQNELANRAGVSQAHVSEILKGRSSLTLDVLEKFAAAFKVPVAHMLLGAAAPVPKAEAILPRDKALERLESAFSKCDARGKRAVLEMAKVVARTKE